MISRKNSTEMSLRPSKMIISFTPPLGLFIGKNGICYRSTWPMKSMQNIYSCCHNTNRHLSRGSHEKEASKWTLLIPWRNSVMCLWELDTSQNTVFQTRRKEVLLCHFSISSNLWPPGWPKPLSDCSQEVQLLSVSDTTQIHPEQEAPSEAAIFHIFSGSFPALFQNDSEPPIGASDPPCLHVWLLDAKQYKI